MRIIRNDALDDVEFRFRVDACGLVGVLALSRAFSLVVGRRVVSVERQEALRVLQRRQRRAFNMKRGTQTVLDSDKFVHEALVC